jgi:hypothetical protein
MRFHKLIAPFATISMALSLGCASRPQAVAPQATNPVIVKLVGRHETITITAGPSAPLYTIVTSQGQTLVANITLSDLRKLHPDLYEFYAPNISAVGSADASVWAADSN